MTPTLSFLRPPLALSVAPIIASVDDVLSPYVLVFCVSFAITFVFAPVTWLVASSYGLFTRQPAKMDPHDRPLTYLGGFAVLLGWVAGLAASQFLRWQRSGTDAGMLTPALELTVVASALIVVVTGLLHDAFTLRPRVRIFLQTAAAITLIIGGIGTSSAKPAMTLLMSALYPILTQGRSFDPAASRWFEPLVVGVSCLMVVAVVIACCSSTDVLAGEDGICSGLMAVITGGLLFVAVHITTSHDAISPEWDHLRVVLGLSLFGTVLAITPYALRPPSILMGNTGSMLVGFYDAVLLILIAQDRPKWLLAAIVMFAMPVLDSSLGVARRWIAGPARANSLHFHEQLLRRGFTVRQTMLIVYGLSLGFALIGAAVVYIRTRYVGAVCLVTFGFVGVAAYKMGMIREQLAGGSRSTLIDADTIVRGPEQGAVFVLPDEAHSRHGDDAQ